MNHIVIRLATHHHSQWTDWTLFHGRSSVFRLSMRKIGHSIIDTPFYWVFLLARSSFLPDQKTTSEPFALCAAPEISCLPYSLMTHLFNKGNKRKKLGPWLLMRSTAKLVPAGSAQAMFYCTHMSMCTNACTLTCMHTSSH